MHFLLQGKNEEKIQKLIQDNQIIIILPNFDYKTTYPDHHKKMISKSHNVNQTQKKLKKPLQTRCKC